MTDMQRSSAMDTTRSLATPEEARALAAAGAGAGPRLKMNCHIHLPPNFSAFDTVEHAVSLAAEEGIGVIGASNYYDYSVYADLAEISRREGIYPLFGLEIIAHLEEVAEAGININDPGVPGKMYICGKGITRFETMTPEAAALLGEIRKNDTRRIEDLIEAVEAVFCECSEPARLTPEKIIDRVVARHACRKSSVYLQERHVVQAFQEVLFELFEEDADREAHLERLLEDASKIDTGDPVAVQNALRASLMKDGKPAFVPSSLVSFPQAHALVLALGGIPCYPVLADGMKPIAGYEADPEKLARELLARDVYSVEFIPPRNEPEVLQRYVKTLRAAGLTVTAGTEHNTLALPSMMPACTRGAVISDELEDIFWEGACVVAAHQFLSSHEELGFVDAAGKPAGDYASQEERIADFARLGAALIHRYRARE